VSSNTTTKEQPNTPRALTRDEVRDQFLRWVCSTVRSWASNPRAADAEAKVRGFAHSILTALDGRVGVLPGFVVSPDPHPDDESFRRDRGKNWYPAGPEYDIAGELSWNFSRLYQETDPLSTPKAAPDAATLTPLTHLSASQEGQSRE
jgi:hypothetical protein